MERMQPSRRHRRRRRNLRFDEYDFTDHDQDDFSEYGQDDFPEYDRFTYEIDDSDFLEDEDIIDKKHYKRNYKTKKRKNQFDQHIDHSVDDYDYSDYEEDMVEETDL